MQLYVINVDPKNPPKWSISIKWDKPYPKSWTEHFLNRSLTIRGLKNLDILYFN